MIPKILHYCWLGGKEKPADIQAYINGWKTIMPEYEIIEWNETNFPFDEVDCPYIIEARKNEKWAFVTDYMRLYVLYMYGGIYLDTDVEILRDLSIFTSDSSFIGFESSYTLCTAVIGAEKKCRWVGDLIEKYKKRKFIDEKGRIDITPNSEYLFNYFQKKEGMQYSDRIQKYSSGLCVYPQEYFSPLNYLTMEKKITDNTYAVHHYKGTWKTPAEIRKDKIKGFITRIIGEKTRKKLKKMLKG